MMLRGLIILACALAIAAALTDVRCSANINVSGQAEALLLCGGAAEGCRVASNRGPQPAATVLCSAAWRFGGIW